MKSLSDVCTHLYGTTSASAPWAGLYSKGLILSISSIALRTLYRLYTPWVNKNSFIFCPRNFFQPQKILSWKNSVIVTIEVKLQSH